jgi:energy-coupling factor transporter ATP-binding protein EcfA2
MMYTYGRKWQEALHKILMRLASGDGYGFLVIEGPDASGKTDLLTLVSHVAEDAEAINGLPNHELRELGQLVHAKRYLQICLEDAEKGKGVPLSMFEKLIATISEKGLLPGQPLLVMWDNIDRSLESSLNNYSSRKFLEEMHRPLDMYEHLTFLCTVTASVGGGSDIIGTSAGPDHFLQL